MAFIYTYRNGATVTVFAPYDCANKCPFCINKKEYVDDSAFDIEAVKQSMRVMNEVTPYCDFVITGGEPLADIPSFLELIDLIRYFNCNGANHKLYVNTTLPIKEEDIDTLNACDDVITGFNISRHLKRYVQECPDEWIGKLTIPVRINCVLYNDLFNLDKVPWLIERFEKFDNVTGFQFRDNYIGVGPQNLFDWETNPVLHKLEEKICPYGGLKVFTDGFFRYGVQLRENVVFHRTSCSSKLILNESQDVFIGDVIINPKGEILDDWNEHGSLLDVNAYAEAREIYAPMKHIFVPDKK